MILQYGCWIIVITGCISVLKAIIKSNFKGVFKVAFQRAVTYIGLRMFPVLMNMIKGAF